MNTERRPLVILTGPTAVGKSELSVLLAERIGGEIISADSMQVYRGMDIGSAKITKEQMRGIPHHLLDILEPSEEFNVVLFQQKAKQAMDGIYERGHIPILVGGTGFYIQAVLYDIDFTENDEDTAYRIKLEKYAEEHGNKALYEKLREVDPKACESIHENNVKRVIRALEFHEMTGQKISEHNETERNKQSPYNFAYFVLNDDREKIYQNIDKRVDEMLRQGLEQEVLTLFQKGYTQKMVSMQGLGYKEMLSYLQGECSLEEAVYIIKRDTRHFAKRQLTWFRRERNVIWIDKQKWAYDNGQLLEAMLHTLQEKGIWHAN